MQTMSGPPIIRLVSWPHLAVNLLLLFSTTALACFFTQSIDGLWIGAGIYVAYSLVSRRVITRAHRQGIRLMHQQRYADAVQHFQDSLSFFTRHSWLDHYRAIVMLSPSAMSYREMAMCNLAFCYAQLDRGVEAKSVYQAVLNEYPHNRLAPTALQFLRAGQQLGTGLGERNSAG